MELEPSSTRGQLIPERRGTTTRSPCRKALGVAHYDYGLSAHRVVTGEQITEVLGITRSAPQPLLVHCKSGADRTGLVSALYRVAVEGKNAEEADRQLLLVYGHFPTLSAG